MFEDDVGVLAIDQGVGVSRGPTIRAQNLTVAVSRIFSFCGVISNSAFDAAHQTCAHPCPLARSQRPTGR